MAARVRMSPITVALCLAILAAAALAAWARLDRPARPDDVPAYVVNAGGAARDVLLALHSVSAPTVDEDLAAVDQRVTGQFQQDFSRKRAQLRKDTVTKATERSATVRALAVASAKHDRVVVLVAIVEVVKDLWPQKPCAIAVMVPVKGRWLLAELTYVTG